MNVAFYFVPETALTSSSAFILLAKSRQKANSKKLVFKTATKLKAQSKCGEMFFFFLNPEIFQFLN
jgi:hypothetical protein